MILNALYLILAALGLSFLVFIHELGHYIVARRCGMKVEVFSIGFGKPFYFWYRNGVRWQICFLLFGGYVKIAGMEKENGLEPYQIPDGFYAKKPIDRIFVAVMGPVVNIVFALLLFSLMWIGGGREKPFSEFTNIMGWVDPTSELYAKGIRPGDQILRYNHEEFHGFKDLLYTSVLNKKSISIEGESIDYLTGKTTPFYYNIGTYDDPRTEKNDFKTIGILSPASYLIYDKLPDGRDNPLPEGSPMVGSGIQYKDRIVWVNGELVFSLTHLRHLINEPKTLLTIKRGHQIFLAKIPRLKIADLRLQASMLEELDDWHHEAALKTAVKELYFIPYQLTSEGKVVSSLSYIGDQSEERTIFDDEIASRGPLTAVLKKGDQIVAVDGYKVSSSLDFLKAIQEKRVQTIVQRNFEEKDPSWKNENAHFVHSYDKDSLNKLIQGMVEGKNIDQVDSYVKLKTVIPMSIKEFPFDIEKKNWLTQEYEAQEKYLESIKDFKKKQEVAKVIENSRKKVILGVSLQDLRVKYNPSPLVLFSSVVGDTFKTLSSLVSGKLNPKWMSGPIGMVQVIQHGMGVGVMEAMFWLGAISLNLGIFNLLPLPVLDGGHICLSIYEWVTKRKLKAKTMEKLIVPFIVILIALFVYVTYQDVMRLFTRFFN